MFKRLITVLKGTRLLGIYNDTAKVFIMNCQRFRLPSLTTVDYPLNHVNIFLLKQSGQWACSIRIQFLLTMCVTCRMTGGFCKVYLGKTTVLSTKSAVFIQCTFIGLSLGMGTRLQLKEK